MASIIRADAIQNLNTSNIITQSNATTLTIGASGQTVTIPSGVTFNTSSASINLPAGSVGISQLSATGTASSSTYLRGDNTWQTISSTPATLKSSITLKSAASITAGKLASINSSGQIVNLPTLNTYGTLRTNPSNTSPGGAYTQISYNGSTTLSVSNSISGGSISRATLYGSAISNSANPTNGSSITNDISMGIYSNNIQQGCDIYPIGNNTFMVMQWANGQRGGCVSGCGFYTSYYVITVDSSTGALTKGTVTTQNNTGGNNSSADFWYSGQITKDILITYASNGGAGPSITKTNIVTWSGTTPTSTTDTDAQFWYQADGTNSLMTTSNILCLGVPNTATWRTALWTASPPAIGTKTDVTAVADYASNGTWSKMDAYDVTGASYVLFTYTNTSGNYAYNTFSINQTTGALTSVESASGLTATQRLGTILYSKFKNSSSQVNNGGGVFNSIAWTNGTWQGLNANGYTTTPNGSQFRLNSGDLWYSFSSNNTNYPTNIGYTVNAYSTDNFNYIGVVDATTSVSPASIVTDGVAGNFSGLTAGNLYYATLPYDGTVTATSGSLFIGKAISTTQILLQRSNTQ